MVLVHDTDLVLINENYDGNVSRRDFSFVVPVTSTVTGNLTARWSEKLSRNVQRKGTQSLLV